MQADHKQLEERAQLSDTLKQKLVESLDIPYAASDIANDTSLIGSGLGLDSLDILEIVLCLENNFSVKIPENSAPVLRSINTLVDFIISEQKENA